MTRLEFGATMSNHGNWGANESFFDMEQKQATEDIGR
jgi:hypothetical protein